MLDYLRFLTRKQRFPFLVYTIKAKFVIVDKECLQIGGAFDYDDQKQIYNYI